jgi:hypothetical protein
MFFFFGLSEPHPQYRFYFFSKFHPLYGYPLFRYELKIKSEIKVQRVGDFMDNYITWTLYIL